MRKLLPGLLALFLALPLAAFAGPLDDAVAELQHAWEVIRYQTPAAERERGFEGLATRAHKVSESFPSRSEPLIWEGIIVSSLAGEKGGLGGSCRSCTTTAGTPRSWSPACSAWCGRSCGTTTIAPPKDHKALTPAEATYIREGEPPKEEPAPPNSVLLRMPQTWGLMLCRFLVGPVVQFYIYWPPEYLYRQRGFSLTDIAFFAWVPFLFGDLGSIGGGWLAGHLINHGYTVRQARIITMGARAILCFLSLAVVLVKTVPVALVAICLVQLVHTALSANMFAAVSDTFPNSAVARVTGLTGVAGGISGMLFPLLTGVLVDRISYVPVFALASLMPAAGLLVLILLAARFERVALPETR